MYQATFNGKYLCHYNKNHSPKNGQFISGDGDGDGISDDHAHRKVAFDGKSKAQYVNEMRDKYRKNGESKNQAKRFAKSAAVANSQHTKWYNKSLDKAEEYSKKAEAEKRVGNTKAYNVYIKKMMDAYRDARINEKMINEAYNLGRASVKESDLMLWGGVPAYSIYAESNPNSSIGIRRKAEFEVDYEDKHKNEANL